MKGIAACMALLLPLACTDGLEEQPGSLPLRPGEVALQCLPANMAIHHVKTRATDIKTGEEQRINNLHVFIFKADGSYLTASESDAFQGYRYVEGGRTTVLQSDMFGSQADAENATIVVVANVPRNTFGSIGAAGYPESIPNLAAFDSFVYNLPAFTATLPADGLPMYGRMDGADLSSDATSKIIQLQLKSMMARIDLDFRLEPYPESGNSQYPSLRFDEVRVANFPVGATIVPQLDNASTTETTGVELQPETTVTADDFTGHAMYDNGQALTLTLYMFEHARNALTGFTYPNGITEEEKQRYKNLLASGEAARITLTGIYTNHNGYKYAITYTICPGANATDDFTIKANCQYRHNISVRGITVNSLGKEALLDTRVDIDTEENPYFIEMLREREHDAHFCVTPMDVYIYTGGTVKVKILDSDVANWIRMEPMKYSPTSNGKACAEQAGEGKRLYFTTDLVTNTLADNTEYTVRSDNPDATYEERIYFYIDENIPTEQQANNHAEVPERTATIEITYTEPAPADGSAPRSHTRNVLIRQAGMLPVQFSSNPYYYFYIEYYEEYLEHYDGKDLFTHVYDGLEWGLEGVVTGLGDEDYATYLPYGWRNTMTMMQAFRNTDEGRQQPEITLNDKPRSAAEYCYNKNKRNSNGRVGQCHWYLPSIREIENAMDKYYGTFDVFQNNWYWSSNPGPGNENRPGSWNLSWANITNVGESTEYARATRSQLNADGESFTHATSEANKPYAKDPDNPTGWDTWYNPNDWRNLNHGGLSHPPYIFDEEDNLNMPEGEGGFARRNKVFRIRAAYIYEAPWGSPSIDNPQY